MKAGDILDAALALMFETRQSAADYVEFAPKVLNMLLPELLGINNQLRGLAGKEPLEAPPVVSSLEDEIAYEDSLWSGGAPVGAGCVAAARGRGGPRARLHGHVYPRGQ